MIQVYTGNGKGKTTAALCLALRSACAGLNVLICQFLKGKNCSEINSLKKLKNIKVVRFGSKCFIRKEVSKRDLKLAKLGLNYIRNVRFDKFDLIILDEINIALHLKLIDLKDILGFMENLPRNKELILTGRNAHPEILKKADLVSEVKEIKHYFNKGIRARKGIEY